MKLIHIEIALKIISNAKGIIFDVDGLLIDSEPLWQKAMLAFFERHRLDIKQVSFDPMGMGLKECVLLFQKELGLEGNTENLMEEYRSIFYEFFFGQREGVLKEGACDLIIKLARNKKLAVATGGHSKKMMSIMLKQLDLQNYFSAIVSSDQVSKGKPAPDVFLFTANELKIPVHECVIFEDSLNGVFAAQKARIPVIAVNNEQKIYQKLMKIHPDTVIHSLIEII